jgi:hypothetical protein
MNFTEMKPRFIFIPQRHMAAKCGAQFRGRSRQEPEPAKMNRPAITAA